MMCALNWIKARLTVALLYGAAFAVLTFLIQRGPDLGRNITYQLLASTCGWLIATAILDGVCWKRGKGAPRSALLIAIRVMAIFATFLVAVFYFLGLTTKASYSEADIQIYLLMVFLFGALIRTAGYSGPVPDLTTCAAQPSPGDETPQAGSGKDPSQGR